MTETANASGTNRHVADDSLLLVRTSLGALLLCEVSRFLAYGWVSRYYLEPTFLFPYPGFEWVRPMRPAGMYGLLVGRRLRHVRTAEQTAADGPRGSLPGAAAHARAPSRHVAVSLRATDQLCRRRRLETSENRKADVPDEGPDSLGIFMGVPASYTPVRGISSTWIDTPSPAWPCCSRYPGSCPG